MLSNLSYSRKFNKWTSSSCTHLHLPVLTCNYLYLPLFTYTHLYLHILTCIYLDLPVLTCTHLYSPVLTCNLPCYVYFLPGFGCSWTRDWSWIQSLYLGANRRREPAVWSGVPVSNSPFNLWICLRAMTINLNFRLEYK